MGKKADQNPSAAAADPTSSSGDSTAPAPSQSDSGAPASPSSVGSIATSNTAVLRAPAGCTAVSVGGVQYVVDEGLVEVDERHVETLRSVGFSS